MPFADIALEREPTLAEREQGDIISKDASADTDVPVNNGSSNVVNTSGQVEESEEMRANNQLTGSEKSDRSEKSETPQLTKDLIALFEEPDSFRPAILEPTWTNYTRAPYLLDEKQPRKMELMLTGHHSLWGHHLWNASRIMADYLDMNWQSLCEGKNVIEFGAGAGLPSIIAALRGAEKVVASDYPDIELVETIKFNMNQNIPWLTDKTAFVEPFLWGKDVSPLLSHFENQEQRFDLVLMSDLVFNHTQQEALLKSCKECLNASPDNKVLVFFTHHVPRSRKKDLRFFNVAKSLGFKYRLILEQRVPLMFPQDEGSVELRSTVYGYEMNLPPPDRGGSSSKKDIHDMS